MFENYNKKQERNEKILFPYGEITALEIPDNLEAKAFCLSYIIRQFVLNGRKVMLLCQQIPLSIIGKWIDDLECSRNDVIIRTVDNVSAKTTSYDLIAKFFLDEQMKQNSFADVDTVVTDFVITEPFDRYSRKIVDFIKQKGLSLIYTTIKADYDSVSCETIAFNKNGTISVNKRENILSDVTVSVEEFSWLDRYGGKINVNDFSLDLRLVQENDERRRYCITRK